MDAAGNATNNDYQWYVELVEELPVTFVNVVGMNDEYDDNGWSSVYAPVALEVPADRHVKAYTGEFDDNDYTGTTNINHILATEIAPQEDGKVIIPAGQVALLYYDGEADRENDDFISGTALDRNEITYINLPIDYNFAGDASNEGNLKASYTAIPNAADKDFYTLHASHINNFRVYEKYQSNSNFIPGFKAYIDEAPEVEGEE